MLVKITAQGYESWSLEQELSADTTIAKLKELLSSPPHCLEIGSKTKVLWRRANNCLMALLDSEKVKGVLVLLNATPTVLSFPFPENFVWGTATAAYQIEGAVAAGGRKASIWDTFAKVAGNIANGESGEVACEHYFRFREDVKLMKELGMKGYRFSISWSRLLPDGRGDVNPEAVTFYRSLLLELQHHKIEPMATIYHWDLPQALEDEYGGWRSRRVLDDFEAFAAACFASFGDLVKTWITVNEPWCIAVLGYANGEHAPGRKEDAKKEPYLVAHHLLLAHARAVKRYRSDFKGKQGGKIGMSMNMDWKEPLSGSEADLAAQGRAFAWQLGWFADPIYKGNYPVVMRNRCKDRLPSFTEAEQKLLKGSADFFGLNHYSSDYVSPDLKEEPKNFFEDSQVKNHSDPNWPKTGIGWDIVPWGLNRLLCWIQREYAPPGGIVITENGCAVHEESADEGQNDSMRIEYLQGYLTQVSKAIQAGAKVWGYYTWSFMDNFEWAFGYAKRFGLVHVDYETQARTPKGSARVMTELAASNTLRVPTRVALASNFTPYEEKKRAKEPEKAAKPAAKPAAKTAAAQPALVKPNTEISSGDIVLTSSQAVRLLSDLADRYQDPEFQSAMEKAYRSFEEENSNLKLSKARQALCLPIQSEVLPKYGFEPSMIGVHRSVIALRTPSLKADADVQRLTNLANFLLTDLPQLRVRADGKRRKREEEMEVMEALGMGEKKAAAESAQPPPFPMVRLSGEEATKVLEELLLVFQDKELQDQLFVAWANGSPEAVNAIVTANWKAAWAACGFVLPKDWEAEGWLPVDWEKQPELKRLRESCMVLIKELPKSRARFEAWRKGSVRKSPPVLPAAW